MTTVNGLGELNEFGHAVDSNGNVQVDFVWGGFPLQPDDARGMATLDLSLDNHIIADTGWSNFPLFIPNYSGDDDSELEFVVPDLLRMSLEDANNLLASENLNLFAVPHTLTIQGLTSTGKTVRLYAFDENAWGDSALMNLKVGDQVFLGTVTYGDNLTTDFGTVKVTKVNDNPESSWFEFKVTTAPEPAFDDSASGTVFAGPNLVNIITVQRFWNASGSIKNPGTNIHVRYFQQD